MYEINILIATVRY